MPVASMDKFATHGAKRHIPYPFGQRLPDQRGTIFRRLLSRHNALTMFVVQLRGPPRAANKSGAQLVIKARNQTSSTTWKLLISQIMTRKSVCRAQVYAPLATAKAAVKIGIERPATSSTMRVRGNHPVPRWSACDQITIIACQKISTGFNAGHGAPASLHPPIGRFGEHDLFGNRLPPWIKSGPGFSESCSSSSPPAN